MDNCLWPQQKAAEKMREGEKRDGEEESIQLVVCSVIKQIKSITSVCIFIFLCWLIMFPIYKSSYIFFFFFFFRSHVTMCKKNCFAQVCVHLLSRCFRGLQNTHIQDLAISLTWSAMTNTPTVPFFETFSHTMHCV